MTNFFYMVFVIAFISSCKTLQNNAKYELADGKYKWKIDGEKYNCYIVNNLDSVTVYKLPSKIATNLPNQLTVYIPTKQRFIESSVDIDIVTALFKLRPEEKNVLPMQLNANFNGNIYIGHRTDIYKIHYKKNPLDIYKRHINHFGFSGGIFIGLGNTAINPSTTDKAISSEYDGLVLQKGFAGIVAVNKLTIGVGIGLDNLLDQNNTSWIYENKAWLGLMLGLNLN